MRWVLDGSVSREEEKDGKGKEQIGVHDTQKGKSEKRVQKCCVLLGDLEGDEAKIKPTVKEGAPVL